MTAPAIQRRSLSLVGPAAQRAAALAAAKLGFDSNPFKVVEFSPAFVAFAAYMVAIITYRFPIGTAAMSVALLTLPMEKQSLRLPAVAGLSIALVGWAFLGLMTTSYPDVVVEYVSEFAKVCAVIFVAANVLVTRNRFRAFVLGTVILWGMFPIRGTLFNYFIYHGTVDGRAAWNYIYNNPNDLAGLALLQVSVALGILAVERRGWVRLGTKFAVGTLFLIIVLTQSRGGVIALATFAVIGGKKYFRNVRAIVTVIVLAVFVYLVAPESTWRRFSTIKNATASAEDLDPETVDLATRQDQSSSAQRLAIWSVATQIIADNPVFGVGLGAYSRAHYYTAQRPQFTWISRGKRDTHSTYLNITAETGYPGLFLFGSIIFLTLRDSRRARKQMEKIAPALALQLFHMEVGLYAFLVAGIWGSYGSMIALYVHLVLLHVGTRLLTEHVEGLQPQRGRRKLFPVPAPAPEIAGRGVEASA
jgi:O-antigen ligase